MKRKGAKKALFAVLAVLFVCSIAQNIYYVFYGFDSYLQSTDHIYIMEAGVLNGLSEFKAGEAHSFSYDFTNKEYPVLKEKYGIEKIAGEGTELQRALRLMDEYAGRLQHKSNYDNHVAMNALDLLEYSLDKKANGINCRAKAQILNEMCLSLGIYARKVWIMPISTYDSDCHVVNEVWDSTLGKWVMLDITNNKYWVDKNGTPLSVLEIRKCGAEAIFCTPVEPNDKVNDLEALKEKYIGNFIYIMKNMVYMEYCSAYGVEETKPIYLLFPDGLETKYEYILSEDAITCSPM